MQGRRGRDGLQLPEDLLTTPHPSSHRHTDITVIDSLSVFAVFCKQKKNPPTKNPLRTRVLTSTSEELQGSSRMDFTLLM